MDINSPHTVDYYVPKMKTAELVRKDCEDYLYCGLPYLVPVMSMIWKTHWVPGPEPKLLKPINMTIVERLSIEGGERLKFTISGKLY